MIEIVPVPLLQDNYAYLVHCGQTTVVVDPSEAEPVAKALSQRGWSADAILNTHHHWDHVGGNVALKAAYGCQVICARGDQSRVEGADREMEGGQKLQIGELTFDVLFIPGHTRNHIALWLAEVPAVFTGDTLFLMGCGRLFEGSPAQMLSSLSLLAGLPPQTLVYCGHEYSQANAQFALAVTPGDPQVKARAVRIAELRSRNLPSVPGTVGEECATNPFVRIAEESFREGIYPGEEAVSAFAALRLRKDNYK
jgi:hydroxyacylglutathione hydrolase